MIWHFKFEEHKKIKDELLYLIDKCNGKKIQEYNDNKLSPVGAMFTKFLAGQQPLVDVAMLSLSASLLKYNQTSFVNPLFIFLFFD